jgi:2-(1,2-epoxy-1,2-dihydrophenyl)acetyl-CoA isomerase
VDYETIKTEDRGLIRLITLSRPEKLNAWNRQMSRELTHAVTTGNAEDAIGAFVFTGAGRAFCAGADIGGEFAGREEREAARQSGNTANAGARPDRSENDTDWLNLVRESKPMVAAINGPSIGVGLTLVLPMDFLVAGMSARLSARFVKMGLVPEVASSHFLVQRCGWGLASDLALSGRIVGAEEARNMGLVDDLVPDGELLDSAINRATSYAENPPGAVRMIKQLLTVNGSETDLGLIQRRELESLNQAFRSPEHKEAVAAFLEKREPKFR